MTVNLECVSSKAFAFVLIRDLKPERKIVLLLSQLRFALTHYPTEKIKQIKSFDDLSYISQISQVSENIFKMSPYPGNHAPADFIINSNICLCHLLLLLLTYYSIPDETVELFLCWVRVCIIFFGNYCYQGNQYYIVSPSKTNDRGDS